jgi:DNA-directed RNA polymerase specialized sigma24 family protein
MRGEPTHGMFVGRGAKLARQAAAREQARPPCTAFVVIDRAGDELARFAASEDAVRTMRKDKDRRAVATVGVPGPVLLAFAAGHATESHARAALSRWTKSQPPTEPPAEPPAAPCSGTRTGARRETSRAQPRKRASPPLTLTHEGRTMTVREWAQALGISEITIRSRIRKGRDAAQVLSTSRISESMLTVGGVTLTKTQWAERNGTINATAVVKRLARGWTPEEAVSLPQGATPERLLLGASNALRTRAARARARAQAAGQQESKVA